MSDHHSLNQVPQSAILWARHSEPTKVGSFNRSDWPTLVGAKVRSAMRLRPNGIVRVMPDIRLDKDAIHDLVKSYDVQVVWVGPEYAKHFKPAPQDGRTYVVQDPRRPHLCHWTYPDGRYECVNTNSPPKVGFANFATNPKRLVPGDRGNGKRTRLVHKVSAKATVVLQNDAPPSICLIDIHRVMRITGFKKSFIYEQSDFPEPVRLGTSRRSSVRWVEAEIYQWVSALLSKRSGTVFSGITDSGGNDLGILKRINKPAELKDKEYLAMKLPRHGHALI